MPICEKLLNIRKIFAAMIATNNILNPFLGLVDLTMYIRKGIHSVKKMYVNSLNCICYLQ
jgi:hypothetical protein